MTGREREWAETEIRRSLGSTERLRSVFAELVGRFGSKDASEVWWDVFGARDAAET